MVSVWWPSKVLETVMKVYFGVIASAMMLAFTADTSLYPFWGFKLDASCLQYLASPAEAKASVSGGYMAVRIIVVVVGAWILYRIYEGVKGVRREGVRREGVRGQYNVAGKARNTIFYILCVPLMVIGIRGGLDESTTNIGQVYFSQNQFLNHSAVNPVFSFFASLESTASDLPDYQFMEEQEREQVMKGLYFTDSIEPDSLLKTQRPNIIVILLESCGGIFTEDIGGRKDIMPNLNRLTKEGVYFANFYANTYRTDRGTLCTWSGYPSFPRSSVMKMPDKSRLLPGIAQSLRKEGYHTTYLYGGDINFTNMRSYLVTTGFEKLFWKKDYSREEQNTARWGVRDDITFETLKDMVENNGQWEMGNGKWLIGYSTLSSHEPWDVPTHRMEDEVLNAFNYLDGCIGKFISEMKQSPAWEDLLVIMLPDHGFSYLGVGEEHEMHDHVPMLWLGGAIKEPRRIEQLCNQTDLPATLLGQLGIGHGEYVFSRDVMSKSYRYPFAVHTYNNGITMRDSTGFAVYDLNANKVVVDKSRDSEVLIRKGMAILQSATDGLRNLGKKE
jgi:phosphoglycerol transferase MdoB-like AlkP superfamily enzyme